MHKNGIVKVRMLWLRMVLINILWHLKATLLSFTSSLFIVWAFMSCVLELDPNPGCHTQNHMVHLFLWPRTWWDSAYQNRPPPHTHTQRKKWKMLHPCPLSTGAVLFTSHGGKGQDQATVNRGTSKWLEPSLWTSISLENLQNWLRSPHLVWTWNLPGTLWANRNAPSLFQKSSKCLLAFFQIWGGFFLIKTWFSHLTVVESQGKRVL